MDIPLEHISGRNIIERAIDNEVRNAVTMMPMLHSPEVESYLKTIIRMHDSYG